MVNYLQRAAGPPSTVSNKSHQKSLTYLNHLATFVLFLLKGKVKRVRAWQNAPPLSTLLTPGDPFILVL